MSSAFASFHLTIAAPHGDRYPVTARTQAGHEVNEDILLPLDDTTLNAYQMALDYHTSIDESVVIAVGQLLYRTLFQGTIAEAFATARTHADEHKMALRIHLAIDADTRLSAAAALPWELMATAAGRPLILEHTLVRTFPWNDLIPDLGIPPSERIRLAVTSALPMELANHPIAAEAEVAIIRAAITHSARPIDLIEIPHLARDRLTDLLTNQRPHIVHHIGHGSIQRGMGYLDIERADQSRDRLSAREFSTMIHQSGVQLVVLNACHTGSAGESLLKSFAPIFITDRIPAVIGMQTAILNRTGHCFANAFYATLGTSGSIDQALIAARKAIHADGHEHGAWGFPTLYSRVPHGGLWQTQQADHTNSASLPTVIQNTIEPIHAHGSNILIGNQIQGDVYQQVELPEAALKASLAALEQEKTLARIRHAAQQIESDRLLTLRIQGFVGRVNELAAIREQIAAMRPTGGYVLIKAAAGEGKSSSIAKLIQQAGIAATPHHFIALTTGREYQLGLLRAVVAQLILKHNLTVSYFPEESYPAMKGEFARILDELSKQGIEETIYLDGLDQLQPEIDGSRDLSFLPPQPPPGIVIVLGSRPDETLKPLEILHRIDYALPPLSEADALALWRSVQPAVADSLLHDLYTALKGNALFVHLAADTVRDQSIADTANLIRQIEQNPSNLFGITLQRIKRVPRSKWDTLWKPMLALLLVAQEPLQLDMLGDLLEHDHDTIQDAVWVLGGLVSQGIDQRVALHHPLFRDYLAVTVFTPREAQRWQQRLADWCASDLDSIWADDRDPIEQARRVYARHHYITHLFLAENWITLWQVLDTGDYGEQKTRFDPSTRLYALDLDRGRESAIKAGQSTEEHIQNLPRLWKYSLLRTSLSSRIDQWPDELFVAFAMMGRTQDALERIDLVPDLMRQLRLWGNILPWCNYQQQHILLVRGYQLVNSLSGIDKFHALSVVMKITATIGDINRALAFAQSITDPVSQVQLLTIIVQTIAMRGEHKQAIELLNTVLALVQAITEPASQAQLLSAIASAITMIGNHQQASELLDKVLVMAQAITEPASQAQLLSTIASAIAMIGNHQQALDLLDKVFSMTQSITETGSQSQLLSIMASAIVILGDIDYAIEILNTVLTFAQSITDLAPQTQILSTIVQAITTIVQAIAMRGEHNYAIEILNTVLALVQSITDSAAQAQPLSIIVQAIAMLGDVDYALAITKSINNLVVRAQTLSIITQVVSTRSNNEQVVRILEDALAVVQAMDDPEPRTQALRVIAQVIATRDDIDHVIAIIQAMDDPEPRTQALRVIAQVIATRGNSDRALAITDSIDDLNARAHTFKLIAQAVATTDNSEQAIKILKHALTLAQSITDQASQAQILSMTAQTITTLEKSEQAIEIIEHALVMAQLINDIEPRFQALNAITQAITTHGNIGRALSIAQSIPNTSHRTQTFRAIAQAITTRGERERALIIAQSINDLEPQVQTLSAIAQAIALLGDVERALAMAQSISNLSHRGHTLRAILQTVQSVEGIVTIIQKEWFRSKLAKELWMMVVIFLPLLKEYPWLGMAILEGEAWVNKQLKRLG